MPSDHVPCPPEDERNKEVTYLRLPTELRQRVEVHRLALQASAPSGVEVSRSAAIRNLIESALTAQGIHAP